MPKRELKLNYKKCARCRKDRQNCTPKERNWPEERCDRCMKYGFSCSPARTAKEEAEDERKIQEERGEVPQRMIIRPYKELLEELDTLAFLQRGIESFDVDPEIVRPILDDQRAGIIDRVNRLLKETKEAAVITIEGLKASKKFSEARVLCEVAQAASMQCMPWKRNERFLRESVDASKGLGIMFDALDNQGCLVKAIEARLDAATDSVEAALSAGGSEDEAMLDDRMDLERADSPERKELENEIGNLIQLYADCAEHLKNISARLELGEYSDRCHPLLFHALSLDCVPLVRRLAAQSHLTTVRDIYHRNALHFMAKSGSSRLLRAMQFKGEGLADQDLLERTPLLVAFKHENLKFAKRLLKADLIYGTCAFLLYGTLHGHALGNLRLNSFQLACLKGYVDEAKTLLRVTPDPNEWAVDDVSKEVYGITALQAACAESRFDVVEMLCEDPRVDVNTMSLTLEHPLIISTRHGDRTVIDKLIDYYSSLEKGTASVAHTTCGVTTGIVRVLLSHGADPNVTNRNGWTPMMFAVLTDEIQIIKTLLDFKADPNRQNENGWTALMMAARSSWKPQPALGVAELVNRGASTNLRNNRGETAYDVAKRHGMTDLYELLFPLPDFGTLASSG